MSTAIASMEWIVPALRGRPPLSGGCRSPHLDEAMDRRPTVALDRRGVQIAAAGAGSGDRAAAGWGRGTGEGALDLPCGDGSPRGDAACFSPVASAEAPSRELAYIKSVDSEFIDGARLSPWARWAWPATREESPGHECG